MFRRNLICCFVLLGAVAAFGVLAAGMAQAELIVHYKMDDITTVAAHPSNPNLTKITTDSSGNGYDGWLTGGPAVYTRAVKLTSSYTAGTHTLTTGVVGSALKLNNRVDVVTVFDGEAAGLDATYTNLSIAGWFNPVDDHYITAGKILEVMGKQGDSGKRGWSLAFDDKSTASNYGVQLTYGSSASDTTLTTLYSNPKVLPPAEKWTHVAYTFDAGTNVLYVNGKAITHSGPASPDSSFNFANDNSFQIGAGGNNYSGTAESHSVWSMLGAVDDTAIWNETLSAQRIALIHALGRFVQVDLASSEILNVLNAFLAGPGNGAAAGGYQWQYASGLSGVLGDINTGAIDDPYPFVSGLTAYVVLDGAGNGMKIVPEPSTLALLAAGLVGLLAYAWRKRK